MSRLPTLSPYYRVSAKALIFDGAGRLLVVKDENGEYEMPGGGWEYDESYEDCLRRELYEEIRAEVKSIGQPEIVWRDHEGGTARLKVAAYVTLASQKLTAVGDDDITELAAVRFVTKDEFLALPFQESECGIIHCADKIWNSIR